MKTLTKNKILVRIFVHAIFWLLLFISTLNYILTEYNFIDSLIFSIIYVFSLSLIFYFNYFFLTNLIFNHKKYFLYLLLATLTIAVLHTITTADYFTGWFSPDGVYNIQIESVINLILLLGVSVLLRGYEHWFDAREMQIQLEKENIAKELQFLKSQINPHFLFNTLNNIYSLTYHKDDKAPEMISKLSKLLRYMLYDCSNNRVELKKEVEMIEVYLDLEILRLGDERNIDFYYEGINAEHKIAPLILINIIENAFKHSDINTNKDGWIKIELLMKDNLLNYTVENSSNQQITENNGSGIGIENLTKQLNLNYGKSGKLDILNSSNIFKIELNIDLENK